MLRRIVMSVLSNFRATDGHLKHSVRVRHRLSLLARQSESQANVPKLSGRHFRVSTLAVDDDPPLFV